MSLSDHALRKPVTVLVITLAVLVLGAVSLTRLKMDFLPMVDFPFIGVYVPYPNAVPAQAEKEIARPIEEIMATLGDVNHIFSNTDEDDVFVGVFFDFGRSVDVLRMEVKEKLEQVRPLLPDDVDDTYIFSFNSNDIPIMVGRISAPGRDLANSYDLLERRVINPMRRVEGVGRVEVGGINPKSIRIYLHLDSIIAHGIDIERLFELLNANNIDMSVGRVVDGDQRVTVRTLGQFRSLDELEDLQVSPSGLRLRDIATVDYSEPSYGYLRRLNGESAIAIEVQKASGANIVEVSEGIHAVLEEIRRDPVLEGINVIFFFDQAEQIRNSLRSVFQAGLIGSLLAVVVIYLFLRRMRNTLIASVAMPFCVISACVFLYLTDRSLNVLTMMGLMLAVGMLVDNAIVVLESIFRKQEQGLSAPEAARLGAREVGMAVTASTLTSIIVFAPIVLSNTNEIMVWMSEVGITISVTLVFSLLICLTLVPMLAARTPLEGQGSQGTVRARAKKIASPNAAPNAVSNEASNTAPDAAPNAVPNEGRWLTALRNGYLRMLRWTAIAHPMRTGLVFIPLFIVVTIMAMKATGFEPEVMGDRGVKRSEVEFWLEFSDNTNLYAVHDRVLELEEFLLPLRDSHGVESVYCWYYDNNASFALIYPKEEPLSVDQVKQMREFLRESLPEIAGVTYRFGTEEESGQGAKTMAVTLFGEDTELLTEISEEAHRRLSSLDDLEDVRTDIQEGADEVRVVLDREQGGRFGVDSRTLASILGLTFRGIPLREFQGETREIDMDIVLEPSDRRNIDNLARLPISYRDGRPILLGQIARFEMGKGAQRIHREQQKTAITVRGSYEGDNYSALQDRVERVMNTLDLPSGYSWSFSRQLQEEAAEQNEMLINVLLALCCVYLLMAALFESLLHPLVIMLCIPFAALGVIWTLMVSNTPFNIMAMIGIVILVGLVVNNGIVLVDHINNLRRKGRGREDAILEGCRDRFRPILMAASTTILGLTPLALGRADMAGGYYYPLARAIMGGLATSTVLTLIVLPTFYVLAERAIVFIRQTIIWGRGRGPLPWKVAPAAAHGAGTAVRN